MSELVDKLGIHIPIIQAGMAGGITTPELVAAVAENGALGTIGAGYMPDSALKEDIRKVKLLTDKPFAVNLFAVNLEAFSTDVSDMQQFLNNYRDELDIKFGESAIKVCDYLHEKIQVILEEKVPIVSTAFGVLSSQQIKRLKNSDVTLIGMAVNLDEAKQLEEAGYDIVVAQGSEAGGHRSTFDMEQFSNGSNIGLHVLVQEMLNNLSLPVVAAGGIHSKKQIDAFLNMGAAGVQLGTAFLVAKEAGTNQSYRNALMKAGSTDTVITNVFSGRPARAINNRFIREVESSNIAIPPFPVQNQITKDIRSAGKEYAVSDMQSLWAGQGVGAVKKEETVREMLTKLT